MKQFSRYELKKMFYKNETTFAFENYFLNIKGLYNVLDKYGVLMY